MRTQRFSVRRTVCFRPVDTRLHLPGLLLLLTLTGCRTFNYTEADMERDRRRIRESQERPNTFRLDRGTPSDFGPLRIPVGPLTLSPDTIKKGL